MLSARGRSLLRSFRFLLLVPALVAAVSCSGAGDRNTASDAASTAGVTNNEILIGSSCALTGHAAFLGTQSHHGTLAYFKSVNESGGIHGRRIRLLALDDAYDPALCVVNTQRLIGEEGVFALTGYVGTPTVAKIIPMVQEAQIPLIGLVTGAAILQEPFRRCVINVRASYRQETSEAVRHFVDDLGIRKIAIFYQHDEYGFDGLAGTEQALRNYGLEPVAESDYVRGTTDVEAAVDRIASSDALATVMIGTSDPCAKFIRMVRARRPDMLYHSVSFVGAEELVEKLGRDAEGVLVTQVVPPLGDSALPAAQEYIDLLHRYFPDDKPNSTSFEGFINAKVIVEVLRRAGRDLTRQEFLDTVDRMESYSPGIGADIHFGKRDHQGLDRVYLTVVRNGALVPLARTPKESGNP